MPRCKKRKFVNPGAEPGIAKTYLMENFSDLPVASKDLKKGHVLNIYITTANKSRTETERILKNHLPEIEGYAFRSSSSLKTNIKTIVNQTLVKFKKLNDPKEFQMFSTLCLERFHLHVEAPVFDASLVENIPSTSTASIFDSLSNVSPPNTESGFSVDSSAHGLSSFSTPVMEAVDTPSSHPSRENLTPRKQKLKKRLKFMSVSRIKQKERLSKKIAGLKEEVDEHKRVKIKQLNQQLKRKNKTINTKTEIICDLRKRLNKATTSLNEEDLKRVKRSHERLKKINKVKHASVASSYVSLDKYDKLKSKLDEKDSVIRTLENEKLELEDIIVELKKKLHVVDTKRDGKTYSVDTRMKIFDFLVNQVPTENIPKLMENMAKRSGDTLSDIPNRTTVEQMAREIGVIADLQSSELAMKIKNVTLGFDATTQEGVHINSIHFTTKEDTNVIAVDELPGGTTEDYHNHICDSVDYLASVYADFHAEEFQDCRTGIINNISNTMTDRAAVNHSTIQKLGETWAKSLNELN